MWVLLATTVESFCPWFLLLRLDVNYCFFCGYEGLICFQHILYNFKLYIHGNEGNARTAFHLKGSEYDYYF